MIVCSDCLHQNPDNSTFCESCGVSLPVASSCPNCGAPLESQARFCGQCGFNLQIAQSMNQADSKSTKINDLLPEPPPPSLVLTYENSSDLGKLEVLQKSEASLKSPLESSIQADLDSENTSGTQIQAQTAKLVHVQSQTLIDLKDYQSMVYLGKPNERFPPDINVGTLPNAEVVSRVHAALQREGDHYFAEDLGSANGTYINDSRLMTGSKQRLHNGDRICLGKGDLVTFVFQSS